MEKTSAPTIKLTKRKHPLIFGLGKEKDYIIENLSLLIGSGLDVLSSLNLLKNDTHSKAMKRVLEEIIKDIESGSPFWQALTESRLFPPYMTALIKIGEESGKLIENLKIAAEQDERDRIFRSQLRSAMMYPIFVFSFTVIIGISVAWFILPRLATVFRGLRLELPWITKILINLGLWLGEYGAIAVPLIIFGCLGLVYILFFFRPTKFIGQSILFHLPGTNRLIQELELARFGYLLGTLLTAGIPIIVAVKSLVEATAFPGYRKIYSHLKNKLEEGETIQNSLASYRDSIKYIPAPIQGIISAGEQSGAIPSTLLQIGKNYLSKTEATAKNLTTMLEPILLIVVWFGVMAVALAVFMPIYNLIGGLGNQSP